MPNPGPKIRDYIRRLPSDVKTGVLAVPNPFVGLSYGVSELAKPVPAHYIEHLPVPKTVPRSTEPHVPQRQPETMQKAVMPKVLVDRATGPLRVSREPKSQAEADARGRAWVTAREREAMEDVARATEQPRESEDPELAAAQEKSRRTAAAVDDYKEFLRKGK